jgi:hypothetical protein
MSNKHTVTIGGKTYDPSKLDEAAAIQATLVPDNWPLAKRDAVKLFLAFQNDLAREFKRHLAFGFKNIVKTALEEKEEPGGVPVVGVSFTFDMNMSSLQVAAIGKTKLSFKRNFVSEGKPSARDVNQPEFLDDDDMSVVLNTEALAAEMAPPPDAPEGEKRKPGRPKKTKPEGEVLPMENANDAK